MDLDDGRDTLCGVATGTPDGGVAVVRLSGPRARAIAASVCSAPLPEARAVAVRWLRLEDGTREQALVLNMPGPGSFTGEDVVELHVHAGALNVRAVTETLVRAGARPAGPGDFTRRAFESGRIDLSRAEGIAALIGARTEAGLAQARRLVAGELGDAVAEVGERVFALRAEVEANLDFPEDVEPGDVHRWVDTLDALARTLDRWLAGFERGRRARERPRVVVAGPPNVGKSTLFNALVGMERAIVSDQAGTTRDYLESEIRVGSMEVVLVDTAGQRSAEDGVEAAGVGLARAQVRGADVIVWVEGADAESDPSHSPVGEEWSGGAQVLRVENKRDLGTRRKDWLGVSAHQGTGLDALGVALAAAVGVDDGGWIGLARHRQRAEEAREAMGAARRLLEGNGALELVAFELGVIDDRLGAIQGRTRTGPVGEEVLTAIFSRFCIGK